LHQYLGKIRDEVLPKSEAGHAIAYALKNWRALTRYLEDGDLSIDNNHTERSLQRLRGGTAQLEPDSAARTSSRALFILATT
jgi:hypothetical protein